MTIQGYIPEKGDKFIPIIIKYEKPAIGGICTCKKQIMSNTFIFAIEAKDSDGNMRQFMREEFKFQAVKE